MSTITSLQIGQNKIQINNSYLINFAFPTITTLNNYGYAYFPLSTSSIVRTSDVNNNIFEVKNNRLFFKKKGIIQVNAYARLSTSDNAWWLGLTATINDDDSRKFLWNSANEDENDWSIYASGSGSTIVQANDFMGAYVYTQTSKTIQTVLLSVIFTEIS